MLPPEIRVLVGKEWRQLLRSRGALASAFLLPALVLLFVPLFELRALPAVAHTGPPPPMPPGTHLPPALLEVGDDPRALLRLSMPLLAALGGLTVPAVTATYTLVAERESRTLELLAALPVRIAHVLIAKLLVIGAVAAPVTSAMLALDAALLVGRGIAGAGYVLGLYAVLLSALSYSTASALLTSLLARDLRTANNVNGALLGPTVVLVTAVLFAVPGSLTRMFALAGLFVLATVTAVLVALRVVTFERLLR
jgi:ABC-2 type transport system permease protein